MLHPQQLLLLRTRAVRDGVGAEHFGGVQLVQLGQTDFLYCVLVLWPAEPVRVCDSGNPLPCFRNSAVAVQQPALQPDQPVRVVCEQLQPI